MEQRNLNLRVLGVGLAIIDYIANVDHFPSPDEKMRSQSLECAGGGNCYNALSMLSSMGVNTRLVSKIGADPQGNKVLALCKQNNIDTQNVVVDESMNTGFSFIIADVGQGTRTIVYNPGDELNVENNIHNATFDNTDLIYFDGRFTKAALRVAELMYASGTIIPSLLDCERARGEEFEELRRQVQYLVVSQNYIKLFKNGNDESMTNPDREVIALERVLLASNRAHWVVLTLGSQGSLSIQRLEGLSVTKLSTWPGLQTVMKSVSPMHLSEVIGEDYNMVKHYPSANVSKFLMYATKQFVWKNYLIQYCPTLLVETAGVGAGDKFIAVLAAGVLLKRSNVVPHLALGSLAASIGLANIAFDWSHILI